jgi:hypothetical protein
LLGAAALSPLHKKKKTPPLLRLYQLPGRDAAAERRESDAVYTGQFNTDKTQLKECEDEAMEDWDDLPEKLKKTKKKAEFVDETAKKYWKMKAADFVREKRLRVTNNKENARSRRCGGPTAQG